MDFTFPKPLIWQTLPLYKKVEIYGTFLNQKHAKYVDKLQVKPFVLKLTHNKIKVANVIRELKSNVDIRSSDINPDHLLKAAHGSNWLLDFKEIQDLSTIKTALNSWNQIYSQTENQYKYLRPRFFIEEKINCKYSGKSGKAYDIKVHCIRGEPQFMLLRNDKHQRNYFDTNWEPVMPLEFPFACPENFSEIMDMCKILSKPFEYVRVDLYMGKDGIYFSEYTFTPHGGKQRLSDAVEIYYGSKWTAFA